MTVHEIIDSGITAADPAGYVEATIRPDGQLAALRIDPRAMYDLTAAELAGALIEAIQRASSARPDAGQRTT
ncbi:YbaB/EbfC family nucleoid-associated protein [Micromonospora avicenniae]|uniref:YbaB/EbfC family nucleoid-associated protein n=1 Tax=Micromonospora avicenniae TaxID=1198245 RepID=UPI0034312F57